MAGMAQAAFGAAPVLGGIMLALTAGQLRGPDYRALIKQDMDLVDRLPPEAAARRAELQRTIDERIDDLIAANDKGRAIRIAAASRDGNWRDFLLFLAAVLFAVVWWNVNHSRTNWLPTFVVLILLAVVTAAYAVRAAVRTVLALVRARLHGGRAAK